MQLFCHGFGNLNWEPLITIALYFAFNWPSFQKYHNLKGPRTQKLAEVLRVNCHQNKLRIHELQCSSGLKWREKCKRQTNYHNGIEFGS